MLFGKTEPAAAAAAAGPESGGGRAAEGPEAKLREGTDKVPIWFLEAE